jgi:hypothetical protein
VFYDALVITFVAFTVLAEDFDSFEVWFDEIAGSEIGIEVFLESASFD